MSITVPESRIRPVTAGAGSLQRVGSGAQRKAVRIGDVAAAAGVSRTTASDALNGTGRVSQETRAHVEQVAAKLGFQANHHARMLRGGRSRILGFVNSMMAGGGENDLAEESPATDEARTAGEVTLEDAEHFTSLLTSTSTAALSRGYGVMLLPPGPEPGSLNLMIADGVVLHDPVQESGLVAEIEDRGVPLVSTGRLPDRQPAATTWVDSDIREATGLVLDHMHSHGARRFALVSNPPVRSYTIDTVDAYERWTKQRGLQGRIVYTDARASQNAAFETARDLFAGSDRPDAVFAPIDRLAAGAMLAAREQGLTVPGDVLVAAGSDSARARSASPPITAVQHDTDLIGHRAVDLLIARIENPDLPPEQVITPTRLMVRASTGGE